jgi:hypothetical protein
LLTLCIVFTIKEKFFVKKHPEYEILNEEKEEIPLNKDKKYSNFDENN